MEQDKLTELRDSIAKSHLGISSYAACDSLWKGEVDAVIEEMDHIAQRFGFSSYLACDDPTTRAEIDRIADEIDCDLL